MINYKSLTNEQLEKELKFFFDEKRTYLSKIDLIDTEIIGIKEVLRERREEARQRELAKID